MAAAIVGDDLHMALVRGSVLGVRVSHGVVLRDFLGMAVEEARRGLEFVPPGARMVLVAPSGMFGVRPIGIAPSAWPAAREEVRRSIGSLFPIGQEDALVGYLGRRSEDGVESGYVIAAARSSLQPWLEALGRAGFPRVEMVLPPHMALLGLGLQQEAESLVIDRTAAGTAQVHRLRWGEVVELNAEGEASSRGDADSPMSVRTRSITASYQRGASRDHEYEESEIPGRDLAVAGALAPIVAPRLMAPVIGPAPRAPRRWALAGAAYLGAAGILWLASWAEGWRLDRAVGRGEAEAARRSAAVLEVCQSRDRVVELAGRLETVRQSMPAPGMGALSTLAAVHAAMPGGAFLYRVEADAVAVTLKGEAKRSGDVLRAVEDSPAFRGARELDTPVVVEERGLEMFNIRAQRAAAGEEPPR